MQITSWDEFMSVYVVVQNFQTSLIFIFPLPQIMVMKTAQRKLKIIPQKIEKLKHKIYLPQHLKSHQHHQLNLQNCEPCQNWEEEKKEGINHWKNIHQTDSYKWWIQNDLSIISWKGFLLASFSFSNWRNHGPLLNRYLPGNGRSRLVAWNPPDT